MKCNPDMAGCGIEYSWGKLKIDFRRLNRCNGIENEKSITFSALEHMAKKEATNRNILEIGRNWIHNACAEN